MPIKLNQIVAVEKGTKEQVHKGLTAIYQSLPKVEPMQGISRTYQPKDDDGEKLPPENKYVQVNAIDLIDQAKRLTGVLVDVTATKEIGNTLAKADIVVDGKVLAKGIPVSCLLFLEKMFTDVRTFISQLPKLDPAEKWSFNEQQGYYESDPSQTARTKKVTEFVVVQGSGVPEKGVAPQVKEVTNDIIAGYWTTVKFSATLEPTRIAELAERADKMIKAIKFAREEANGIEIEKHEIAAKMLDFIFE